MAISPFDPTQPFVVGPGGKRMTPEQVAREREMAQLLMQGGMDYSPVDHWLQGAARAAQGFAGGLKNRWADEAEQSGLDAARGKYGPQIAALLGGNTQVASIDPVLAALSEPPSATDAMAGGFLSSLVDSESGDNWNALNPEGYGGRLQFGDARLADAARAGIIPAGVTGAQFSQMSPEQQQAVEAWHFADIDQQAANMGLDQYFGQTIGGVPINQNSIRSMAHLGGIGGAQKFITSGGAYDPSDSNGTSLSDYGARFGGGDPSASQQIAQALFPVEAYSDPWAQQLYGPVMDMAMKQRMQQMDPAYQIDMQLKQAQLANASAPQAPEVPAAFQTLDMRARAAGYQPGTPEYQQFMANNGAAPEAAKPGGEFFDVEGKLRSEYQGQQGYKDYVQQEQAYQRVLDSAKDASPAGDLALIFNYMKVLDPGSVVRESEFATAAASGSFGDRIQAATEQVMSGKRLSPEQRRDFVQRAGDLFSGASGLYGGMNDRYSMLAGEYGVDPTRIIRPGAEIGVMSPGFSLDEYLGVGAPLLGGGGGADDPLGLR